MDDERLLGVRKWFSRFAVALGGFLIFLGIIVIGVFFVGYLDLIDISIFETESIQNLSLLMLLAIGLIDLVAGVMLWRR